MRKDEDADPLEQYVGDGRYVHSPCLRWRDGDIETAPDGTVDDTLYYTNDANMNVTALVNTSGTVLERVVYDPYGTPTFYDGSWANESSSSSYANEILYCGYRFDTETGLYHVRHRMYHPTLGRWMQRDPIGYQDGMNLYQYVAASPLVRVDPYGLDEGSSGAGKKGERSKQESVKDAARDAAEDAAVEAAKEGAKEVAKNTAETGKIDLNPDCSPKTVGSALKGLVTGQAAEMVDALHGGLKGFAKNYQCRKWYEETFKALQKAGNPDHKGCNPCTGILRGLKFPVGTSPGRAGKCYWAVVESAGSGAPAKVIGDAFKKFAGYVSKNCYRLYRETHSSSSDKQGAQ